MPEFSKPDFAPRQRPTLDGVAGSDLLLDALADRLEADLGRLADPDDDALARLLGDWRDDLRWPPASALVSQDEAEEALIAGMTDHARPRRGLAAVGSVAAALLLLSGLGAMVAEARPGNALYGLHAMFFDQPRVNDDQVLLSARNDLAKVQQMIDQGQWSQAQDQLAEVSSSLQGVNDGGRKQDLMNEVDLLNSRVESRDPNAAPQRPPLSAGSAAQAPLPAVAPSQAAPAAPPPAIPAAPPTTTKPHHHHHHHGQDPNPTAVAPGG